MTAFQVLLLLFLLFTKHFIADFPLQRPFHYLNKGTYGHYGGIQHALIHASFTLMVLFWFHVLVFPISINLIIIAAGLDGIIHYHIDWAKVKLNKLLGWGPTTHEEFWVLLGLDQFLHAVTYIGLVLFLV